MNNSSPLEQLAAFAICFALGSLSTVALSVYGRIIKSKSARPDDLKTSTESAPVR